MRTEDLIELLGASVERVDGRALRKALLVALAGGVAAAVCVMSSTLGFSSEVWRGNHFVLTVLAVAFAMSWIATGSMLLLKAMRPQASGRSLKILIGSLLAVVVAAGFVAGLGLPSGPSAAMTPGGSWTICLLSTPLFAAAPFAVLVWALRKGAPTRLGLTGAAAGLVAGAIGAAACALHQPCSSVPFIGLAYGGAILLCTLFGALLGPRWLRW